MPRDCPLAALWTASDQLIKGESDLFSFFSHKYLAE